MEKLPPEIALEIFYRLSPESVVQCKLVCKSWRNLLPYGCGDDGNCFANMNLRRRRQHHQRNLDDYSTLNFIALSKEEEGSAVVEFHNTEYNEEVEEEGLLNRKVKRLVFSQIYISGWLSMAALVESCNGLLCLVITYRRGMANDSLKDRIVVCNPLLHEYVTLPLSNLQYSKFGMRPMIITGFGHNPITDEYKVVGIHYRQYSFYIGDVEVYTLGKSSSNGGAGMWRSKGTIKYRLLSGLRSVLINGSIHWLANNTESEQNIVSFNLEDEEFRVMPLPSDLNITTMLIDQLKELKGCLCLIARTRGAWPWDENRNFDIWLLKDFMNKESWVKAFSIKWVEGKTLYSPVAIKKKKDDGDAILCWRNSKSTKGLVSYDPKTEKFEEVGGSPLVDDRLIFDSVLHINSLVSLKALGEDAKYAED